MAERGMEQRPRGTLVHELPVEGATVAGPLPRSVGGRQDEARAIDADSAFNDGGIAGSAVDRGIPRALLPSNGGYRPVSTMSDIEEHAAGEERMSRSPISPTTPTGTQWKGL